jgi:hypothetical protein
MQATLIELLRRRKDRACAIVLGVKEREVDPYLRAHPEASEKLRKVVLDQLNEFYEVVMDIVNSLDSGDVVLNDHYLQKIDDLHRTVVLNGKR